VALQGWPDPVGFMAGRRVRRHLLDWGTGASERRLSECVTQPEPIIVQALIAAARHAHLISSAIRAKHTIAIRQVLEGAAHVPMLINPNTD